MQHSQGFNRYFAPMLWLLTALFAVRVAGQAIQNWVTIPWLPSFDEFQGSDLSYGILLSTQLIIMAVMISAAWRVQLGILFHRPRFATFLQWFAAIYCIGSVMRILVGAFVPDASPWFTAWIPASFHFVLAGFVWMIARCYAVDRPRASAAHGQSWSTYLLYPASVTAVFSFFAWLRSMDVALPIALYLSIFVNVVWILTLERLIPERADWRPQWSHLQNDTLYMLFVHVALPKILAMSLLFVLAAYAHEQMASPLWPHHWHWAAQTVLMALIVDLLRYWVHRACHTVPALWRLHEVHHSPRLLYSLNTSRFHPLEKALHFSADTVPFILLGAAPEVLTGYFLVYAVNGFYQHSNIRLRYGILNYVVGSAETHRWHHALDPKSAACNYGSTTLIWDHVFGTWRLPPRETLEQVGIPDNAYPTSFWRQLSAPFR